ncbi:hypothetical protein ACFLQV_03435 [Calditrichota bacterium]
MRNPFFMRLLIAIIVVSIGAVPTLAAEKETPPSHLLSRMFVAPTGTTLPTGFMNLAFGGSFASQGGKEYLGLISIGLGNIAEFEVSTSHILTNVVNLSEPIGTTSLKFLLHRTKPGSQMPNIALTLRSNSWSRVQGDEGDLSGPAQPDGGGGRNVTQVDFDVHETTLFLSATKEVYPKYIAHGGLIYQELNIRDISFYPVNNLTPDSKEWMIGAYFGVEHQVNELTQSILEVGSKPRIDFDDTLNDLTISNLYYLIGGVRFFLNSNASIDAAIRYRSDYDGLSDMEIRTGLNIGIDLQKEIKKKLKRDLADG